MLRKMHTIASLNNPEKWAYLSAYVQQERLPKCLRLFDPI
jgi:hypothetical protein